MKIMIAGDSTAASYKQDMAPFTGWGQVLGEYLPEVTVENHAMAGRSSKSFLYEGRLLPIEEQLQPGDLLLIQFAHNDENPRRWRCTQPRQGYSHNLSLFIQTARLHGAKPVLLTPICLRSFTDGVLQPSHQGYLEAMHAVANLTGTPLIDLYTFSYEQMAQLGDEASRSLYMNLEPGVWPAFPDGRVDDTHTQRAGALLYAGYVARQLKKLGLVEVITC